MRLLPRYIGALVCVLALGCTETKQKPASTPDSVAIADSSLPAAAVLVGWYQESGGRATFRMCTTLGAMMVAPEGAAESVHREYERAAGAKPVIVSLTGRIEPREDPRSGETREFLVIERFERMWPEESCEKLGVDTSLENTYWRLIELNGAAVNPHEGQREVHVILRLDGQVGGFGGCNHLTGRYQRDGTSLSFADLGSTLMACPYSDEEAAFMTALQHTASFRILGESLDLRDGEGKPIALLRAVYLR